MMSLPCSCGGRRCLSSFGRASVCTQCLGAFVCNTGLGHRYRASWMSIGDYLFSRRGRASSEMGGRA